MPAVITRGAFSAKAFGFAGITAAKDPNFSNVTLLCHFDNGNGSTTFTDNSSYNQTITSNQGAAQSTTQVKFGASSFQSTSVPANKPYLTLTNTNFNFGTASFTIELWYYYIASQAVSFGGFFDNGGQGIYPAFGGSGLNLIFYGPVSNSDTTGYPHGMTNNAWNFLAFVRNGTTFTIYVNGNSIGNWTGITGSCNPLSGSQAFISAYSLSPNNYPAGGFMDEYRITNGIARYTSNFTPPTAPFPNSQP